MTRAKNPEQKKKPGRKPWYHDPDGSRVKFLRDHVEEWTKCKEAKLTTQFYNAITVKFVLQFDKEPEKTVSIENNNPAPTTTVTASNAGDTVNNSNPVTVSDDPAHAPETDTMVSAQESGTHTTEPPASATANSLLSSDPDNPTFSLSAPPAVVNSTSPDSNGTAIASLDSNGAMTSSLDLNGAESASPDSNGAGNTSPDLNSATTSPPDFNGARPPSPDSNGATTSSQAPEDSVPEVEDHDRGLDTVSFSSTARQLGWTGLSTEELKKKRVWFKGRRDKISEWYRVEYRTILTAKSSFSIIDRVFKADPKTERKPVRVADHLVFMDLFYDIYIKAEAEKEIMEKEEEYKKWKEDGCQGPERKPPVQVAIRSSVARHILSTQSEEFQADIKRQANERFEKELKAWKTKDGEVGKNTPQDYAKINRELSRWGPEVAKFNSAVAEANNMIAMTVLVGPNPFKNGQIDTFWSYAGPTYIGLRWPQDDRNTYEAVKKSLVGFGKKVFSTADRATRALPTGPQVTPCGWNNDTDNLNPTTSNPTPSLPPSATNSTSKSRRPGPGRNSQNMRTSENQSNESIQSTRPKPRPRGSKKPTDGSISGAPTIPGGPTSPSALGDVTTPIMAANTISTTVPSAAPSVIGSPSISGDLTTPIIAANISTPSETLAVVGSPSISDDPTPVPSAQSPRTMAIDPPSAAPSPLPAQTPTPLTMAIDPPPGIVATPGSTTIPDAPQISGAAMVDNDSGPGPLYPVADIRTTQKEEPTVWTHPDVDRFWPEMRMFLDEWIVEIREKGWEREHWVEVLEELLEVFIEYEGDFHYTEDNGDICSKLQLSLFKQWVKKVTHRLFLSCSVFGMAVLLRERFLARLQRLKGTRLLADPIYIDYHVYRVCLGETRVKVGRPAILRIRPKRGQTGEELTDKLVSGLAGWWDDVVPVRERGVKEDWAPLDCVSGQNGAWKFICFMVFTVFLICGQDLEMDTRRIYLGAWIGLAERMKETLITVIKWGCQPPKKRKPTMLPEDQPSSKRVTRLQTKQDGKVA
ncbi:hypothetical protein K435DRAFT_797966 [Dendrothele bispora CBS 962.96]|uniref:Uncharacterized protein n=1 Tax=Dendrothele bispora (strain CBS 962.96) TaxID=1314807 RepID=A0A4S8M0V1_DENBC|nr:hypothetical protein K435DRAFT_797966 [Dendrothele bispora CBS 962.96]